MPLAFLLLAEKDIICNSMIADIAVRVSSTGRKEYVVSLTSVLV